MRRLLPVLLIALALTACAEDAPRAPSAGFSTASAEVVFRTSSGQRSLSVRVADTEEERARGLMGVRELPAGEGMAFVFDGPSTGSFWMQGTLIPLAIAFVAEGGHILGIVEMSPCTTDPCPSYSAPGAYAMAIEANAGWFATNGIKVGDETVLLEEP